MVEAEKIRIQAGIEDVTKSEKVQIFQHEIDKKWSKDHLYLNWTWMMVLSLVMTNVQMSLKTVSKVFFVPTNNPILNQNKLFWMRWM